MAAVAIMSPLSHVMSSHQAVPQPHQVTLMKEPFYSIEAHQPAPVSRVSTVLSHEEASFDAQGLDNLAQQLDEESVSMLIHFLAQ